MPLNLFGKIADDYLEMSEEARQWISDQAEVWHKYYDHDPVLSRNLHKPDHPHYRKSGVPKKDHICTCQLEHPANLEVELTPIVLFPRCLCLDLFKAMDVFLNVHQFHHKRYDNVDPWEFWTAVDYQFCQDAWNAGKYGREWDDKFNPPYQWGEAKVMIYRKLKQIGLGDHYFFGTYVDGD